MSEVTNQEVFLRIPAVLQKIGLGRSWLYDSVEEKTFPQPIKIGKSIVFAESEVNAWMAARLAARDAKLAKRAKAAA